MTENYYALIMAGGGGTRLWPLSRKQTPKQLIPLVDDRTMFKTSIDRLAPLFTPDRILVVTGPQYVEQMKADVPEIPPENFIVEPHGRNTGPAAALAIGVVHKRNPDATIALLTADHHIGQEAKFRDVLTAAYTVAQDDYIVTLGISPTFPSTGFGYIHQGEELCVVNGFDGYRVLGFKEKPDEVTATQFITSGSYSWNSGMFIWTSDLAMREFARQQPQMQAAIQELLPAVDTPDYQPTLERIWEQMPALPIDIAVMEGAEKMAVFPVDMGWSDIGSWSALFGVHKLDEFGNSFTGADQIVLETRDSMVRSKRLIVTIGVKDLIVIDSDDALLICHRDNAQDVKKVVSYLRENQRDEYL